MHAMRFLKDAAKAYVDRSGVPFRQRLRMTRLGFTPESYAFFEFDRNDPRDYLPSRMLSPLMRLNGPALTALLSNKVLFWQAFRDELPIPRVLAVTANGYVKALDGSGVGSTGAVLERAADGPLVLKPMLGQKGRRVRLLEREGGEIRLDGQTVDPAAAESAVVAADGTMVVEFVRQAEYASRIFPGSANTVRAVIFGGAGTGYEPFVAALLHRFGREQSVPVDNASAGGLAGRIDPASHQLGPVATFLFGANRNEWIAAHPDTGAPIVGVKVPRVGVVLERLLEVMRSNPGLAYVGWDVVITDDAPGFAVIEANHHAALQSQRQGYPYLKDERVVRFLAHHDLLGRIPSRRDGAGTAAAGRRPDSS